ncbi:MAG: LPS-assembly protein LptD, partial [Pyrinomonadaceae bacterium]
MRLHKLLKSAIFLNLLWIFCVSAPAQQPNPVERQVANPMTDTPNVNPLAQEEIRPPQIKKRDESGIVSEDGENKLSIDAANVVTTGEEGSRVVTHTGNVDVHLGIYRLQADKVTIYQASSRLLAEGNVVFDQGVDQRITGTKADWNYKTKLGYFENSTGFTNQTNDGTIIYFTASRVERVSLTEIIVYNAKVTACVDAVPKWSFTQKKVKIITNKVVKLYRPTFRVKDIPIIPLPYASISLKKRDRQSGFLTPTFGFSAAKGFRLSGAYYLTLGRSADATIRGDIYSSRGIGYGLDVRTRANSRSYLDFGFYAVKDRIFGAKAGAATPDQGGTIVYAQGVHYFSNGFTATADVKLTSSLDFRQVFSDGIQQIISPIEVSQVFVNKSWSNYTLNILARSQVISIPNVRVKTRNLPSINFDKRPSRLKFLKDVYFSFKTSLEGVSRREAVDDVNLYRQLVGSDPIKTPAIGQRFDIHPQISIPFTTKYFNFTATAGFRSTYYSDSLNGLRQVIGKDVVRSYGEFELDARPVALARNFYGKNNAFKFRHSIEPYLTYRYVKGVNNFNRLIRFDYVDTFTDTNEIEYGVTNRFFTRR